MAAIFGQFPANFGFSGALGVSRIKTNKGDISNGGTLVKLNLTDRSCTNNGYINLNLNI